MYYCQVLFVSGAGLLLIISFGLCAPTANEYSHGVDWLRRYGYLPPTDPRTERLQTREGLQEALRQMQRFGGIRETGILDDDTLSLMKTPRCSLPDIVGEEDLLKKRRKRRKRYALSGLRWQKKDITWSLDTYPNPSQSHTLVDHNLVDHIISEALQVWSSNTPLHFSRNHPETEEDIRVSFTKPEHGDGYPFDGRGGTLAHAFFPGSSDMSGDTHFDNDEIWSYGLDDRSGTTDLFTVAVHEFGHALGLSHSSSHPSIMSPYYQGTVGDIRQYKLPDDDRLAIQSIYDRCVGTFDAVANIRGEVFFFKGAFYWRYYKDSLSSIVPSLTSNFWVGLPQDLTRIDSVYERSDHHIVFFIGDQYWVFDATTRLDGYPRPLGDWNLRTNQGQAADRVEAVFVWAHNGQTYVFSGGQYWRFKENGQARTLDSGYPRMASIWSGVPSHPDDIITWKDGDTYFFKDTSYWVLKKGELNQGIITAKSIAEDWMICQASGTTPNHLPNVPESPRRDCDRSRSVNTQASHWLIISVSILLFSSGH
ncbi:hypothetical protein DPEC_G00310240 [Dallia pectoralis]|uniref:Uncharacterized protein n=1 Tax=Dallia pectoralis TaxID=75939 RepID=A0ACC2FEZ0_DALPE|nr:hypothetical protein DPEC_G00310240 [Dallia pectoralis]